MHTSVYLAYLPTPTKMRLNNLSPYKHERNTSQGKARGSALDLTNVVALHSGYFSLTAVQNVGTGTLP